MVANLQIEVRPGISNTIDVAVNRILQLKWYEYLVVAYGILIPVLAFNLPGVGGLGAADLLMPVSGFVLLATRRVGRIQLPHIALLGFCFAALVSLIQIDELKPVVDCLIRWIRLFGILIPFYFALHIPTDDRIVKLAFRSWIVGGLTAILIGIFLHTFQIEVRSGQQRLWMDGGSVLRAGGLIGNSGVFGHMTSTWTVICVTWLVAVSKHKLRFIGAALAVLTMVYVIYISSSRAAVLNFIVALMVFAVLLPLPKQFKRWLPILTLGFAVFCVFAYCLAQWPGASGGSSKLSKQLESSLARFVPGLGGTSVNEFTSNRADNWPEYIEMMNEKLLTGWGYKMGVRLHEESPDNSYMSVMLETGALGFACMAMFVTGVLFLLLQLYLADDPFALILLPVAAGQLANCMTSDIYTFWITMPVIFMLLGLVTQRCVALRKLRNDDAVVVT